MRIWILMLLSGITTTTLADDACVLLGHHRPAGLTFTRYICWSSIQEFVYLDGTTAPAAVTFSWELIQEDSSEQERYRQWLTTLDCPCRSQGSKIAPRFANPLLDRLKKPKAVIPPELPPQPEPQQTPTTIPAIEPPPLEQVKPNDHFSMNIGFQSMSDDFEDEDSALRLIRNLADYLARHPQLSIKLMGVIDNRGPPCSWTRGLALQRAQAVERVLLRDGLAASRILKTSGARAGTHLVTPKSSCNDPHPENRRIIVRFFDARGREVNGTQHESPSDSDD